METREISDGCITPEAIVLRHILCAYSWRFYLSAVRLFLLLVFFMRVVNKFGFGFYIIGISVLRQAEETLVVVVTSCC